MTPKVCIFSGSPDNLNTSMTVRLDDGKTIEVWISDQYADQATPKAVKEAYLKKQASESEQLRILQEAAARLGLKLVGAEQAPPEPAPKAIQVPQMQTQTSKAPENPVDGARIISGKAADKAISLNVNYAQEGASSLAGGIQAQYNVTTVEKPTTDLKEGEVAEIGIVKGRSGMDIAIPVRRSGKTGTTRVAVVNTGGDAALQQRFKAMAQASESGQVNYGKSGYDVKFTACSVCGGKGLAINGKSPCPKCKGAGEVQVTRF